MFHFFRCYGEDNKFSALQPKRFKFHGEEKSHKARNLISLINLIWQLNLHLLFVPTHNVHIIHQIIPQWGIQRPTRIHQYTRRFRNNLVRILKSLTRWILSLRSQRQNSKQTRCVKTMIKQLFLPHLSRI